MVIGYGVQTKKEITGSIAKVEAEELSKKIAPSFEAALQGQAAGVSVTTGSGMAGSSSIVRVRGIASINASGDPLYVVDGIPITQDIFGIGGRTGGMNVNPLSTINPNDIENIQILKDAAATGIYGSRGANGVVLITTKRSKGKKLRIDFSTKQSISGPTQKVDMTNTAQWLQLYKEAWENDGNTGIPQGLPGGLTWDQAKQNDTDWWDEVTRNGYKQEYVLAANFGLSDKIKVYSSISFLDDQSYLMNNDLKRTTGRLNLDYSPLKNLKISLSGSYGETEVRLPGNPWDGGLGAAMGYALPIYPIKNADGTYFKGGGNSANPVMVNNLKEEFNKEKRTINSINLTYIPFKNFTLTANGAVDYMQFKNTGDEDPYLRSANVAYKWENTKEILNYNYSIVGNYNLELDKSKYTFMLGHESQYSKMTGDDYNIEYLDPVKENKTEIDKQEWRFMSFFGRINYIHDSKYIAQLSLRADGSSRFGKNNKYGYFPTVALGWVFTEESFFKNIFGSEVLSFGKLKASYGLTGNSNIPNYEHFGQYELSTNQSSYYAGKPIRYPKLFENPDLKWETTESYDIGLEARFLNGRISTELAYYLKKSSDVFVNVSISGSTGYGSQWQNLASIENEGFEFNLKTRNLVGDFKWSTDFNIATLRNEVTDLGGLTTTEIGGGTNDTRILLGYPVGTNRLVRFSRIDKADGRPIYLDKNGNETKTYKFEGEEGYAVPVGKVLPDFTGGITNTFEYKNFSLSCLFTFSYGADIYDSSAKRQMGLASDWNWRTDVFNRWQKPGDDAKYPRMSTTGSTYGKQGEQWFNSDMWLFDGSYLRLKNVSLSYNMPKSIIDKFKMSSLRLSLMATNLLTFTKYPGADPEVARDHDDSRDRNMSSNVSFLTPPQERVYTFSIKASF